MATTVNFEAHTPIGTPGNGQGSKVSGTISLADVVVNTTPNTTGGFNTATVTADLQRSILVTDAQGITAGIPPGWYEKVDILGTALSNLFRRVSVP